MVVMPPWLLAVMAGSALAAIVLLERLRHRHARIVSRMTIRGRISLAVAEGLAKGQSLGDILHLLVPDHADWCVLHLVEEGRVRRVFASRKPEIEKRLVEHASRGPFV